VVVVVASMTVPHHHQKTSILNLPVHSVVAEEDLIMGLVEIEVLVVVDMGEEVKAVVLDEVDVTVVDMDEVVMAVDTAEEAMMTDLIVVKVQVMVGAVTVDMVVVVSIRDRGVHLEEALEHEAIG